MEYYKPLPKCVTIKNSPVHGLGIFATEDIFIGTNLGHTHIIDDRFEDGVIRLPLGGFFNHSEDPNCKIVDNVYKNTNIKCLDLVAIKDIKNGEELTAYYTLYNPLL